VKEVVSRPAVPTRRADDLHCPSSRGSEFGGAEMATWTKSFGGMTLKMKGPNTEASRAARQKPHGRDLKWKIVESAQFKAVNLRSKFLKRRKRNGRVAAADGNGGGAAAWRRLKPQIEDIAPNDTDELTTGSGDD